MAVSKTLSAFTPRWMTPTAWRCPTAASSCSATFFWNVVWFGPALSCTWVAKAPPQQSSIHKASPLDLISWTTNSDWHRSRSSASRLTAPLLLRFTATSPSLCMLPKFPRPRRTRPLLSRSLASPAHDMLEYNHAPAPATAATGTTAAKEAKAPATTAMIPTPRAAPAVTPPTPPALPAATPPAPAATHQLQALPEAAALALAATPQVIPTSIFSLYYTNSVPFEPKSFGQYCSNLWLKNGSQLFKNDMSSDHLWGWKERLKTENRLAKWILQTLVKFCFQLSSHDLWPHFVAVPTVE